METIIEILEASVKKNGKDKVLTIGHLLNILKIAQDKIEKDGDGPDIGDLHF